MDQTLKIPLQNLPKIAWCPRCIDQGHQRNEEGPPVIFVVPGLGVCVSGFGVYDLWGVGVLEFSRVCGFGFRVWGTGVV